MDPTLATVPARMTAQGTSLKRTLGLPSLIAVGVGLVVGQGALVSVLQGVGTDAPAFLLALLVAFVLTLGSTFTFAGLALLMPRSGGISTYTEVAIGHVPAIVVTLGGYVGVAIFAGAADLFLLEFILETLYPGAVGHAGLWIYVVIVIVNLLGIELFASAQNALAWTMLAALLAVTAVALGSAAPGDQAMSAMLLTPPRAWSVLSLTVLALWAFLGLEFVCPMVEETRRPERAIPTAMVVSACILLVVYGGVALAGYRKVPGPELVASTVPHWVLVKALLGDSGRLLTAVIALTAAGSTFNTSIAGVARMLYGMAVNGQLPRVFARLDRRTQTPWVSVLMLGSLSVSAYFYFRGAQDAVISLMISAATVWLLVYMVAHVDLIILRRRYPAFPRPFRSPWYPWFQVTGIVAMIALIVNNSPSPEMTRTVYTNTGLLIGALGLYAVLWTTFRMKKNGFTGEPLAQVLGATPVADPARAGGRPTHAVSG